MALNNEINPEIQDRMATNPFTSLLPLRSSFSITEGELTDFWSACAGSVDCDAMFAIRGGYAIY